MIAGAVGKLRDQHCDNSRGADRKLIRGMTQGTVEHEITLLFLSKREESAEPHLAEYGGTQESSGSVTSLSCEKRRIAVGIENDQEPTRATGMGQAAPYDESVLKATLGTPFGIFDRIAPAVANHCPPRA